jgi:Na+/H+-dicarboxylate symporter
MDFLAYYVFFGLIAFLAAVWKSHSIMELTDYFVVLFLCLLIWPFIIIHGIYVLLFENWKEGDE